MTLESEVEAGRKDIRTDDYAMSIGEWISLYESGDLDIHPEFQRFFRWTDEQKSNLIESILLGIPLPPIFVSQRGDGIWDVIDGLQRLSTIFQLVGIFADHNNKTLEPLRLKRTKYIPSLEGKTWDGDDALPLELKRIIRRSRINVSIVLRESDENTKYDLFERLNTGGSKLSDQEVRNCILVMVDTSFFDWIKNLSEDASFQDTIALSDKPLSEAYDLELVLRFLIFTRATVDELTNVGDVGVYISSKMVEMAQSKAYEREAWGRSFRATFEVLSNHLGDAAFKRYSTGKSRHEGGFVISQFEAVTAGVLSRLDKDLPMDKLPELVSGIWFKSEYTDWAKSGITASRRLRRIIPFARQYFLEA